MVKRVEKLRSSRNRMAPKKYDDFVTSTLGLKTKVGKDRDHRASKNVRNKARVHHLSIFSDSTNKTSQKLAAQIIAQLGIDNMKPEDYIPTTLDNPTLVSVKEVNLLSKMGGKGLFANQKIEEGTCLGIYTGSVYLVDEYEGLIETKQVANNHYAMSIGRLVVDAITKGNFTRYINFSDSQANVEFVEAMFKGKKVVKVFATGDIEAGQQLLVDYNIYEEQASKAYFFLNPTDGWKSAYEVYKDHQEFYNHYVSPKSLPIFSIQKNDEFYLTDIAKYILSNKKLEDKVEMLDRVTVDLPCFKANENNHIIDFDEADTFTPLMLACYLGQVSNVFWLVSKGALINQQQNHSGNCPLFLALAGYADASKADKKAAYIEIMELLIENNANLFIHDRADKLFLHKAIAVLSLNDFDQILSKINELDPEAFLGMFSYVDEYGDDLVTSALRQLDFDKFMSLLSFNPNYFDFYNKKGNEDLFMDAIKDYSDDDKWYLFDLLRDDPINLNDDFLLQLGFDSEESTQNSY